MLSTMLGTLGEFIVRGLMVLTGYITNSSTFPQPLNEEEEARYLTRLQSGDDEARAVLIERNLRLVAHIVNTSWAELQEHAVQIKARLIEHVKQVISLVNLRPHVEQ